MSKESTDQKSIVRVREALKTERLARLRAYLDWEDNQKQKVLRKEDKENG